jgi:GT2 family glycosyltransferase
VKTFERPRCVANFLASVRRHYPAIRVLVCDDSREPLYADGAEPAPGVRWLTLPFAAGHTVGAGRNHLLARTETPLFFLADDDHVFNRHTRLDCLHGILTRHALDLVGGAQGRGDYGCAVFVPRDSVVEQRFLEHRGEIEPGVVRCDRVSNTFLARTDAVRRMGGWEERVLANEHADFFLRATRAGLRIAQAGYVYVDHDRSGELAEGWLGRWFGRWLPHRDREYHSLMVGADNALGLRGRDARERQRRFVFEKNGVSAIVDVANRRLRRPLERAIGAPFYDAPPCPSSP